ncbi:hypothetical protein [Methanoregula sp. UBA64]|jgi:hypothetical protein|uniref:hypothetical protein n=1 Tax=Methanoregula sp. UBA64 TaxID=1915554 RepID=UPI0025E57936|nr:hypothetical protein [Methanoregula sp. UBA64]
MSAKTQNSFNFFRTIAISTIIILLWVVPFLILLWQAGTPGSQLWGLISLIALPATIASPLVYGWLSRDSTGAILIGTLPFLIITGLVIITGNGPGGSQYLAYRIAYIASLILAGGLEGFFAAKKTTGHLVIALLLAVLWAGIFFSGIH